MLKTVIILLCAVALDGLIPKHTYWRPTDWLANYTAALIQLLHPRLSANAPTRHFLRGAFALFLQITPIFPLLVVLYTWTDQAGVLDLLLLFVALDYVAPKRRLRRLYALLQQGQFDQARHIAHTWLTRDPDNLTPPELARAALETYALIFFRRIFTLLCWFIVLGGVGAWLYWLIMMFDRQCARLGMATVYFRTLAMRLCAAAEWLPARLFALTVLVTSHPRRVWRCWRNQAWHWRTPADQLVLAIVGGRLGLMLGGPTVEYGYTLARPYLGIGNPVTTRDLRRIEGLMNQCLWRWLLGLAFLAWIIYEPFNLDAYAL